MRIDRSVRWIVTQGRSRVVRFDSVVNDDHFRAGRLQTASGMIGNICESQTHQLTNNQFAFTASHLRRKLGGPQRRDHCFTGLE
jgi:hypothetical protein